MYILLCLGPLDTVLYCTVISSFINIPQLGHKVLCKWIMVLSWSMIWMINIFEKLIVVGNKLINHQSIGKTGTLQKSMSHLLHYPKEMVISWSNIWISNDLFLLCKPKVICLVLKCSSFSNILVILWQWQLGNCTSVTQVAVTGTCSSRFTIQIWRAVGFPWHYLGLNMGNLQVWFSHTIPIPWHTVPVAVTTHTCVGSTTRAYMRTSHDSEVTWCTYTMSRMHAALKHAFMRNSAQRNSTRTLNLHINEEPGTASA